jgi:4,5:9,10-diseco-3-hydroxy-5,9,17-trioxoandrosta-1(10),2-diene-4-oate hydrolase
LAAAACAVACVSCTDILLTPYRQDRLAREYHYTLGEQYAEVNGLKVCYQQQGDGPDLVIIPGLGTNIDFWQQAIPAIAPHCRVWAMDPPGFGRSEKPDASYDLPWMCDQVLAFMDAMHIEKATLMGGSLGGHLALLIAINHPQRVDRLILMGSCGAWPAPGPLLTTAIHLLWNDAVVADHMRRNWPDIYRRMFIRQTEITQRIFRFQMAVRANAAVYLPEGRAESRALRSIFFNTCCGRLPQVRQPALLIWGESDHFHLLSEAHRLRRDLPNSRLVVVPDCGHEVMCDQPEVFNNLVITFLTGGLEAIRERPG